MFRRIKRAILFRLAWYPSLHRFGSVKKIYLAYKRRCRMNWTMFAVHLKKHLKEEQNRNPFAAFMGDGPGNIIQIKGVA
jgi:hypothetical protein